MVAKDRARPRLRHGAPSRNVLTSRPITGLVRKVGSSRERKRAAFPVRSLQSVIKLNAITVNRSEIWQRLVAGRVSLAGSGVFFFSVALILQSVRPASIASFVLPESYLLLISPWWLAWFLLLSPCLNKRRAAIIATLFSLLLFARLHQLYLPPSFWVGVLVLLSTGEAILLLVKRR